MLKHRVISGVSIIAVLLLGVQFLPAVGIALVLILVSALAQMEFYALVNRGGIPVFRLLGVLCGSAMIATTFVTTCTAPHDVASSYRWENLVLLFALFAVFVRQFPQRHNEKPLETLGGTLLGICYVPYLMNYFTRLGFGWDATGWGAPVSLTGKLLGLYLIIVVKVADVGAYFTGRRWGRHKLSPRISPGKTWEGLVGGIAASLLASVLFCLPSGGQLGRVHLDGIDILMLGVLLPVSGVIGDMFESLLKRAAGTKDSSSAIPGMGGLLDVLDSLLFSAPVMYLYLRVVL